MKKHLLTLLLAMILLSLLAVRVEFTDNLRIDCEVSGKQADTLFVSYNELLYKVKKEDIRFINAQSWSSNQKSLFFEKKDWLDSGINPGLAKIYRVNQSDYNEMVRPATLKSIDDMNEREFQIYLAQTQAQAVKDSSKKINRTLWILTVLNVALGITIAAMK